MSRHRVHVKPRHGTQRRGAQVGCGVSFYAAAGPFARRVIVVFRWIAEHGEYRRVIRGAFLAPWFAVSLGVVIAAALTAAEPLTALSFPPNQGSQCARSGCANPKPDPAKGSVRSSSSSGRSGSSRFPAVSQTGARPTPGQVHRHLPGLRISYAVVHKHRDQFTAIFLITASRPLEKWTLQFTLIGTRIGGIMWGKWAFERPDMIVIDGSPSPWPRSAPDQARIVVFGTGTPQWPTHCVYDGARCSFGALGRSLSAPHRPGRRHHGGWQYRWG